MDDVLYIVTGAGINRDSIFGSSDLERSYDPRMPDFYYFKPEKLGWINCDDFVEIKDTVSLNVQLQNYKWPIGYIVFSDLNAVMEIFFDQKGRAIANGIPKEHMIDIVIVDQKGKSSLWAKKKVKTGSVDNITLVLDVIAPDSLKHEIERLDKVNSR